MSIKSGATGMNKKHLKLLLPIFLIFILSFQLVFAATGGFFQNNPILKSLFDMLGQTVPWPPYNATPGIPIASQPNVPVFLIILVWLSLFAVLYVLANNIELFSKSPHKGAIMWFCIAFAGIAVSGTSFVNNIAALVDWTQGLLAIFGFIVITILLVGVLWSGSRLGGGMISPSRWGNTTDQTKALEEGRERDTLKREIEAEKKIFDAEDKAIDRAKNLLARDITLAGDQVDQLKRLIKIAEQLERIRDLGKAGELKVMFRKQAATLASYLGTYKSAKEGLNDIMNVLKSLEKQNAENVKLIEKRIADLKAPFAPPLVVPANVQRLIDKLTAVGKELEVLETKRVQILENMDRTLGPMTQATDIRELIQNSITNIYNNNPTEALRYLNDALNERQAERNVALGVGPLLTEGQNLETAQKALINEVEKALKKKP